MIITMKTEKNNLPFRELYAMRLTFLIGVSALGLIGLIYSAFAKTIDFRIFTGIFFGAVISGVNFYLLAYSTEKTLKRKNAVKARASAGVWFGVRFLGMAGIYAILFAFDLVNIFTALLPLFFPKIHYTVTILKNKP